MKRKRVLSAVLALSLALSMAGTAFAEDITDVPIEQEQNQEQDTPQNQDGQEQDTPSDAPTTVATADELQEAITAAENGDTIYIAAEITLDGVALETDKQITLAKAEGYTRNMLRVYNGTMLKGLTIQLTGSFYSAVVVASSTDAAIRIEDCAFVGDNEAGQHFVAVYGDIFGGVNTVEIKNTNFSGCGDNAITTYDNTEITVADCIFQNNRTEMQGAAIRNSGMANIQRCAFNTNTAAAGGAIYSNGVCCISDCSFSGNAVTSVSDTEQFGGDVFSTGKISITAVESDHSYYEETTGLKVELPVTESESVAKLIWLTAEEAKEHFTPAVPDDTDNDNGNNTTPTEPSEPSETPDNGDGDTTSPDNEDTPTEPSDKPNGNDDTNTEPPVTPEPPQDDTDDDDDYTPPIIHRPTPPAPEPEPEPIPVLTCGTASIDASRSIVLLGYGDGDLHEDDNLTRAQLATIVYRLLDDTSIEQFDGGGDQQFADVSPDAWCYQYVQTIAQAGIVYGVGGGSYNPNGIVTWAQVITVLSRFVEPQDYELQNVACGGWALSAVQTAAALGWIEDSAEFNPDTAISRGELVQLVNSILEQYR